MGLTGLYFMSDSIQGNNKDFCSSSSKNITISIFGPLIGSIGPLAFPPATTMQAQENSHTNHARAATSISRIHFIHYISVYTISTHGGRHRTR